MAGSSSVSSRWRYQSLLRWKDSRESRASRADLLGAAQEIRQIFDPAADSLAGQDGQIIRFDHKKDQLPAGGFGAVVGELADPHELPRGLPRRSSFFCCLFNGFPPFVILLFQNQKAFTA